MRVIRIADAIERGVQFLLANRESDNLWRDFTTAAGPSEDWASAFVSWCLGEAGHAADAIPTLSALLPRQRPNGGWSYSAAVPTDCDTTAWCLLALAKAPHWRPSAIERAITYAVAHQSVSGGFATYAPFDGIERYIRVPIGDMRGWMDSHVCVTGTTTAALASWRFRLLRPYLRKAVRFLAAAQSVDGLWGAYWWQGSSYASYWCIKSLRMIAPISIARLQTWTARLARQWHSLEDGRQSGRISAFATSFGLLTLLLAASAQTPAVETAARWLIENQCLDGSWRSSPILRIPPPSARSPIDDREWPTDVLGTGVVVSDKARLFTTSAAVWALAQYRRQLHVGLPPFASSEGRNSTSSKMLREVEGL